MSYSLHGPFPFDVNAVTTSARGALGKVNAALEAGLGDRLLETESYGEEPGLYLVLRSDGDKEPRIAGFWVVFGVGYFDEGVTGPPDRHPPYARGLLDALTEEVWWRNLRVASDRKGVFLPVVILEWLPSMAVRASLYPPGVHQLVDDEGEDELPDEIAGMAEFADLEEDEGDDWLGDQVLDSVEDDDEPADTEIVQQLGEVQVELSEDEGATADEDVPTRRSLMTVIQGKLTHDSITHHGEYWVVMPADSGADSHVVPIEHWVAGHLKRRSGRKTKGKGEPEDAPHRIGPPLDLPGERVGYPLSGWVTRSLGMWPPSPANVHAGVLTDRIVQSRWQSQALMGISSTLAVFVMVLIVSLGVRVATVPRPRPTAVVPPPAAQPAMSVCSADHHKFVTEFRCQVAQFADPMGKTGPVCSDLGSENPVASTTEDLRPLYCGLLDREQDGWLGNFSGADAEGLFNFAELSASQACFNVLGHPHPYTQPTGYNSTTWALADPERFLDDPDLRIQSLVDLVDELEDACEVYRTRMEHRVEGAVLATHVGAAPGGAGAAGEAAELRQRLINGSMVGTAEDAERCFRVGAADGLEVFEYGELCGEPDSVVERMARKKIWMQLAGSPIPIGEPEGLIPRYGRARFGSNPSGDTTNLWKCHLALDGQLGSLAAGARPTRWDLTVPVPDRYDITGGQAIRSQVVLDAALLEFEEGMAAGTCWQVVDKRLDQYATVHPLIADLDDSIWISTEQQLCGQVCAAFYQVEGSTNAGRWVTRDGDLSRCISTSAPGETPDLGRGSLDRLRVPWNGFRSTGWVEPSAAEVCAFNLIAQDYMPAIGESYLVGGKATAQWAGETATGSRIAGGQDGLATKGAENMSSYGRSRSSNTCGYVAAQCFTGSLVDIIDSGRYERYEWRDTWMDRLVSLANATPVTIRNYSPWCQLVQPYLHPDGNLPEGEIDFPCASGVDQALRNVEGSIRILAKDTNARGN